MTSRRWMLTALLVLLAAPAAAEHPIACPDGTYQVAGRPLFPAREGSRVDTIVITGDTVALGDACPAAPAVIRPTARGGTVVRARWQECAGARRVRLLAYVRPGCDAMVGFVGAVRPLVFRRFKATRCDDHLGCPTRCRASDACPATDYCARAPGHCGDLGQCAPRPDACPDVVAPVCGCDRHTYGNACEAAAAGVAVAREGRCPCVTVVCQAGFVPVDRDGDGCTEGCVATCTTACDCVQNPDLTFTDSCPLLCPLCGNFWACDAGACVEHCGILPPDPCTEPSACRTNDECDAGSYCAAPGGECSAAGQCRPRPTACTREYVPVCGCDGQTYGNACTAAAAGVRIAARGACQTVCGGIAGIPCAGGEMCEFLPGSCHITDAQGTCVQRPGLCIQVYAPVCGCDGQTYSNDCTRRGAGVAKAHDGACRSATP